MTSAPPTPFQERFQEILDAASRTGTSQETLASQIGCSKNMITHWKAGRHEPQRRHAEPISRLLGISVHELFERPSETKGRSEPADPNDLLSRLTALELDVILKRVQEAAPHLQQLQASIPGVLDLLNEAKRHVREAGH